MTPLPTSTRHPPPTHLPCHLAFALPISRFRRARARLLLALLVLVSLYALSAQPRFSAVRRTLTVPSLYHPPASAPPVPPSPPLPPFPLDRGMAAIAEWEASLPQSEVSSSDVQGGERYLRYLNERVGIGFNNQLQEILVHAHLAYLTNRTYVVQPLQFPGDPEFYPLSAYLRGTILGSPSSHSYPSHRASHPHASDSTGDPIFAPYPPPRPLRVVSRRHFARACPHWQDAPEADYEAIARTVDERYSSGASAGRSSESDTDSPRSHRDTSSPNPQAALNAATKDLAPSYMTLSFHPLGHALGFERDPPADVIMRGWAGLLRMGDGRGKGAARRAPSSGGDAELGGLVGDRAGLPALAPGDVTCVMVHAASFRVFHFTIFSTLRILPLLPALLDSPVLTDLHWSPLVHGAAQRNLRAWGWIAGTGPDDPSDAQGQRYRQRRKRNSPRAWIPDRDGAAEPPHDSTHSSTSPSAHSATQHADPEDTSLTANTLAPLPRLLAVHLRRGDFEQHCAGLERDSAGWQGINEAEGLMDRYTPPLGGLQTPAEHAEFARHCWPSIDDVMRHVRRVRQEWEEGLRGRIERRRERRDPDGGHCTNDTGPTDHEEDAHRLVSRKAPASDGSADWRLNTVYVCTNGDTVWWDAITSALRADGWEVRGSADMDFVRDVDGPSGFMRDEHGARFIQDTLVKEGRFGGALSEGVDELDADGEMRSRTRRESERIVGLAVDMEIAARAEVFIGNGWSTFTSNVNLLRMAHGAPPGSIRFW